MFFAIPLTTREDGHTGVDVFVKSVFAKRPVGSVVFKALLKMVSMATLGVFMIPAWKFALRAAKYPQYATLVRWFNTSWLVECMFMMLVLSIFHSIHNVVVKFIDYRRQYVIPVSQEGK